MTTFSLSDDSRQAWHSALSGLAVICGVFIVAVSVVLILGSQQVRGIDPVQMPLLDDLQAQIIENPGNEQLRENARKLDLVLRRSVFDFYALKDLGGKLLLIAAAIMTVAIVSLRRLLPPDPIDPERSARVWRATPARMGIGATAVLGCAALVLVAMSDQRLTPLYQADLASLNTDATPMAVDDLAQEVPEQDTPAAASEPVPTAEEPSSAEVHWMGFRNRSGQGKPELANAPTAVGDDNLVWKVELPKPGLSSTILVGDLVLTTGGDDSGCALYALRASDGALLWEADIPASADGGDLAPADSGWAAPTPVSDGTRIYANAVNGTVIATDLQGNTLWVADLGTPMINYGYSSSLEYYDNKVFVQWDTDFDIKVLALDAASGEKLWETEREVMASWASPIVTPTDPPVLVLAADPAIVGYDIETGEKLWSHEGLFGEVGPSPSYGSGIVVAEQDGSAIIAVDPVSGEQKWINEDIDLGDTPSPLVTTNNRVYVPVTWGMINCLDGDTGEKLWEHEFGNSIWSSPIQVGNNIYLFDQGGFLHVFADSADGYEEVASSSMDYAVVATPALTEDRLYIRGGKTVYAFGK